MSFLDGEVSQAGCMTHSTTTTSTRACDSDKAQIPPGNSGQDLNCHQICVISRLAGQWWWMKATQNAKKKKVSVVEYCESGIAVVGWCDESRSRWCFAPLNGKKKRKKKMLSFDYWLLEQVIFFFFVSTAEHARHRGNNRRMCEQACGSSIQSDKVTVIERPRLLATPPTVICIQPLSCVLCQTEP